MTLRSRDRLWAIAVGACVCIGLWLRVHDLGAEGFADDEVHKWLAANRYLHGDFGGDDVEHPMLMKWLIALAVAVSPRDWAPEVLTRLPNAIVGALTVGLVALLGRKLFGRLAGGLAAALAAVSPTFIGYQRVAKEDTLVCAFLLLMLWCLACAAEGRRRLEVAAALSLSGMLASKYYFFFAPLPLIVYASLRAPLGWHIPLRRWAQLCAIAAVAWLAINWTPLMPSTWAYLRDHAAGRHVATPSFYFMGSLYSSLPLQLLDGVPPWFYVVFAFAKLTPLVFALALSGIALSLRRAGPGQRIALVWIAFWYATWMLSGAKYGRYFLSVLPAFLLFAAHALAEAFEGARRWVSASHDALPAPLQVAIAPVFAVVLGVPLTLAAAAVGGEARAALELGPHSRMYVSPLAGGENRLDWLFPHCDYFDAGLREAVQYVSAHAEPGAEIATEIDLPARFYARPDLRVSVLRPGEACGGSSVCYTIVQPGRIYRHNQSLLEKLSRDRPWHVERIRGHAAATVYRSMPASASTAGSAPRGGAPGGQH